MKKLLYTIAHSTTYDYVGEVSVSQHLLRLTPRNDAKQQCVAHEITIEPAPGTLTQHRDYFGNPTHFAGIETPHQRLVIHSQSRVAVGPALLPDDGESPTWETVRARCRDDHSGLTLEAHEFTYASPLVPRGEEFAAYANASFRPKRPMLEAVDDLTRRIYEDFTFDPTATTVTTPVAELLQNRRGVCQDFAHFQIACLRSKGLPARYVSGYLETAPPPGQAKLRGVDASHAWVSFYCPGLGWVDVDATNNCRPSMRHITIGWGRDYGDVAPIRGVLVGGQSQSLSVSVDVNAVGPWTGEGETPD